MAEHRHQPRAKCTSDVAALEDLCKTHARSITRYKAHSDVEETVKENRAFLVELAALTPRVRAPILAKAVKEHAPEFLQSERHSWATDMKQAIQYCYTHRDVKKLSPATAAVARVLRRHDRAGAPTLPIDARPKPLAAPASSTRGPAEPLRSPPSAAEIAALYGRTPRTPKQKKRTSGALSSPSPISSGGLTSSAALTTTKRRLTKKGPDYYVDLLTPPAAEAPKRNIVHEVDYNRMKLKETDDSGELREFDLAPGEMGMCVAVLADGTTWTSEITNADFAAWKTPPVNKKPAKSMKKPGAASTGAWREDEDEGLTMDEGEGEEGEGEEEEKMHTADEAEGPEQDDDEKDGGIVFKSAWGHVKLGNKFGPFPKPAAAAIPKAKPTAKLKAKPAAAEVPMAKPAAADLGKFTDEKGRTFDHKTEQFNCAMYYKKNHCVGLRVKGGSQLISFGGLTCKASKEYLMEIGRQLKEKLNAGKVGLIEAREQALSKLIFE